jgi:DNA-binding protein HU-beta
MTDKILTKADIIDQIAKNAEITKAQAKAALDSFITMCCEEVKSDHPFRVSGLGTFALRKTQARKGRNPQTGEEIDIKASQGMSFKMSKQIKDLLNS